MESLGLWGGALSLTQTHEKAWGLQPRPGPWALGLGSAFLAALPPNENDSSSSSSDLGQGPLLMRNESDAVMEYRGSPYRLVCGGMPTDIFLQKLRKMREPSHPRVFRRPPEFKVQTTFQKTENPMLWDLGEFAWIPSVRAAKFKVPVGACLSAQRWLSTSSPNCTKSW